MSSFKMRSRASPNYRRDSLMGFAGFPAFQPSWWRNQDLRFILFVAGPGELISGANKCLLTIMVPKKRLGRWLRG